LTHNHDLISNVIQALNHPFYVIDADTYVVRMANTAAYTGELPEGTTCYALTHHQSAPCDRFGEICPLAEIKRGKQPLSVEHLHYDAEGHCEALEVHAFPIFDADGQVTGIIEYTLDISERKEAERLKDEFIAMVSHELRTPLHHIKGYATTLLQTDVVWDAATQHDFLSSINREADRLSDLIEKILHLSSLEAGPKVMQREWYQLADLVDGAVQSQRSLTATRAFEIDLSPDLPALFVDGQQIAGDDYCLVEAIIEDNGSGGQLIVNAGISLAAVAVTDQVNPLGG
jgi:nitrogen-specific signal transduction histidine kinase